MFWLIVILYHCFGKYDKCYRKKCTKEDKSSQKLPCRNNFFLVNTLENNHVRPLSKHFCTYRLCTYDVSIIISCQMVRYSLMFFTQQYAMIIFSISVNVDPCHHFHCHIVFISTYQQNLLGPSLMKTQHSFVIIL